MRLDGVSVTGGRRYDPQRGRRWLYRGCLAAQGGFVKRWFFLAVLIVGCQPPPPSANEPAEPDAETNVVEPERPPTPRTRPLPESQTAPVTRQTQPTKPAPPVEISPVVADLGLIWAEYNANRASAEATYAKKVVLVKSWDRREWGGRLERYGRDYWWMEGVTEIDGRIIFGFECKLSSEGVRQFAQIKPADRGKWQLTGTIGRSRTIVVTTATKKEKVDVPIISMENCSFVRK
jgi:hypothetical protein